MAGLVCSASIFGAEIPKELQGEWLQAQDGAKCDHEHNMIIDSKRMYTLDGEDYKFKKIISSKNHKYRIAFSALNVEDDVYENKVETLSIDKKGQLNRLWGDTIVYTSCIGKQ